MSGRWATPPTSGLTSFKMIGKRMLSSLLCMLLCCLAESSRRNPPKIVTKGGNLVLQAGEDGNIVFEPGQGKQVLIGGNALNSSGTTGAKGEKGDQGTQGPPGKTGDTGKPGQNGTKGEPGPPGQATSVNGTVNVTGSQGPKGEPGLTGSKGSTGQKGEPGDQGPTGKNGTDGIQGPPGVNGTKGDTGAQGPTGPLFNTLNQSTLSCRNSSNYGSVRFMSGSIQVCSKLGWQKLAFEDSLCQTNIPRWNHEAFLSATFGILLQFNGNMLVNLSPNMNFTNITTDYQPNGGRNKTQYVEGIMGQAVQLRGQEYINLHGIPAGFWSGDEWSVMGLMRFHDDGILGASKELAVLGDGEASNDKGFHLGLKDQKVLYGFYNSDVSGNNKLDYNKWYHVAWSWRKSNKMRKIFIDQLLDKQYNSLDAYKGISGKTQIGTWWNGNTKTNVEIDTLYIINKVMDYTFYQQLCFAKALHLQML